MQNQNYSVCHDCQHLLDINKDMIPQTGAPGDEEKEARRKELDELLLEEEEKKKKKKKKKKKTMTTEPEDKGKKKLKLQAADWWRRIYVKADPSRHGSNKPPDPDSLILYNRFKDEIDDKFVWEGVDSDEDSDYWKNEDKQGKKYEDLIFKVYQKYLKEEKNKEPTKAAS
jgi:hypothetical protein